MLEKDMINLCYKDCHNVDLPHGSDWEGAICLCGKFKLHKNPGDYYFSWFSVGPLAFTEIGSE